MKVTVTRSFYGQEGQVRIGQQLEVKPGRGAELIKRGLVEEAADEERKQKKAPAAKNKKAPEPENKSGKGAA